MKNKSITIFARAMYIIAIISMGIMIYNNPLDNRNILARMSMCLILSWIVGKYVIKEDQKKRIILWIVKLMIILVITAVDTTGISIILVLVEVGEIIVQASVKLSLWLTLVSYVLYSITVHMNHGPLNMFKLFIITFNFIIPYILVFLAKYQAEERRKAQSVAEALEMKTKQLERAYEKLQELYEDKEQVIILKERNRIAGEIHDTVGHILTTVVIQLEASKRLIKKDGDLAREKLNVAQKQVKKGLNDIRKSVRALKEGESLMDFVTLLKTFIEEVEKNSEVIIVYSFGEIPALDSKIENIIYRALQEGVTNGIRHGESKTFEIILDYKNNRILLDIRDNGKGADEIHLGFGLCNMKRKVEEVGGNIKISSRVNEGVCINIAIPIGEENRND